MFIYTTDYEGLPDWAKEEVYKSEWYDPYYLVIEDGDYKKVYSDAMEPEDVKFYRDLSWVAEELQRAYARKDINEI